MHNPFPYSDTNKRYHTFDYFLRHRFGGKVAKVSLDAGFTCPNIDGSKGVGGCTYCSAKGSGDFAGDKNLPLRDQFEQVRQVMDRKWPGTRYIPYFQAHTNTYAPLPGLPLPPAPTASATRSRITWARLPAAPIWRWSWGCRPSTTPLASGSTAATATPTF